MSDAKLVAILPANNRSEVWLTTEFRAGRIALFFREQATVNSPERRKEKPAIGIPISAVPKLRDAIEKLEAELQAKGMLPTRQQGQEARRADPATRQGAGHERP
jgi:hypothetical protein